MKTFAYSCCFLVFAIANITICIQWGLIKFEYYISLPTIFVIFTRIGTLLPLSFPYSVPLFIKVGVSVISVLIVVRRLWLFYKHKTLVPYSFRGILMLVSTIGCISFLLWLVGATFSFLFKVGTGIPAAFLLLPAIYCIPWGFFLTELFSFRKQPNQSLKHGTPETSAP